MAGKYIMVSLDDEKSKYIADVLGNKTCNKILKYLAEKEGSESDIARVLGLKLNTAEYNLNKLMKSGFIVKSSNFFWSKKGKKIDMYKLANKSILISPRQSIVKSIIPVALISAFFAYLIHVFSAKIESGDEEFLIETTKVGEIAEAVPPESYVSAISIFPIWAWFLLGAWLALVIFIIWNWRKL